MTHNREEPSDNNFPICNSSDIFGTLSCHIPKGKVGSLGGLVHDGPLSKAGQRLHVLLSKFPQAIAQVGPKKQPKNQAEKGQIDRFS